MTMIKTKVGSINEQEFLLAADRYGVGHAGKSLWRWIDKRTDPGDFLTAVLCNDLTKAVSKADDRNVKLIPNYVRLLYNFAPAGCWGDDETVDNWRHGLHLPSQTRQWRVEITKVVREHYDAETTVLARTEAEAWALASQFDDCVVDFPDKDADVHVEYFVESIKEVAA